MQHVLSWDLLWICVGGCWGTAVTETEGLQWEKTISKMNN